MEQKHTLKTKTFAIIKPGFLQHRDAIVKILKSNNFNIIKEKKMLPSLYQMEKHYAIHAGKPFYNELLAYMTSGEIIAIALEKEGTDAVSTLRTLAGATKNPEEGTIRNEFGIGDVTKNVIHTSDSDETAKEELSNFFPELI